MNKSLIGKVQKSVLSCLEDTSGQSISRILSSNGDCSPRLGGHLSGKRVTTPLKQPTRDWPPQQEAHKETSTFPAGPQTTSSLLDLAPGGGYQAARITTDTGGLLHHLFTITPHPVRGGGLPVFCGPVRQVGPSPK